MIITDLDNCIANDERRIALIDWSKEDPHERYLHYHAASIDDPVGNREAFEGKSVIVFTARPERFRVITEEWLRKNGVKTIYLLMRPRYDHTRSVELKARQLGGVLSKGIKPQMIKCCYDDREDVVQMYRRYGLKAEVRAIHSLCAYTKPDGSASAVPNFG